MDFNSFLLAVLREGGLAAILIFFGKAIIKRGFDKDLESFKADLELKALEHQISYSSVYARRAEVLAELYSRLANTKRAFATLTSVIESSNDGESFAAIKERRLKEVEAAYMTFREFYDQNRLYLNSSICDDLDKVVSVFNEAASSVTTYLMMEDKLSQIEMGRQMHSSYKKITGSPLPQVMMELERQFRETLRIKD